MGFMSNAAIRRTKAEQLAGVEYTSAKKVAHNTIEYTRADGTRVIRLHLTDIVEFLPDGSVRLSTGGFKTHTTKDRLNQYVPKGWVIWADRGVWYVGKRAFSAGADDTRFVYSDGVTFHPDGTITGIDANEFERCKLLTKKISKFCKALAKLETLPKPEAGDCFICQAEYDGKHEVSTDHLESHLDEQYFVGSMIYRAMRWARCTDFVINCAFTSHSGPKHSGRSLGRDHAVRAVRRYLRARLGLSR